MKLLLAVAAVALALASPADAALTRAPDVESRVHVSAAIYCRSGDWPYPEASGYALLAEWTVVLHENVCGWIRTAPKVDVNYAKSLFVLFHELAHIGWQNPDEASADCFALFIFRWEARHNFGVSRLDADRLYDLAWSIHLAMPQTYQGCVRLTRDPLPG